MVFTIFFSANLLLFYYKKKLPNFEKKVLISEVANKTVLVFCMRPNKDTTYTPYTLFRSLLNPIGLKTTLPDLSTFLS